MGSGHRDGGSSGGCIEIFQQENCRVAYTLNNSQPVRCSYIGDQPLFYMDFEGDIDEEFADDDPFGIAAIEKGVSDLSDRIARIDSGYDLESDEAAIMNLFDLARDEVTGIQAHAETPSEVCGIEVPALQKTLRASRFAAALMDMAEQHGVSIASSRQVELALYDREAKTVFINPDRTEPEKILLISRELRRVWQHKNGCLLHPLMFHPDQAILINRAQRADLAVAMIRIAWELQLSGHKASWERLEDSPFSDLTRAFAREAYLDFRTLNNGQAASAVFESWFLSERCRNEDRTLIQHMLSDHQGYMFDSEQASRAVSADFIMALGSVPFGKNYLAQYVSTILSDPIFTEVRDRSNANFLWFIKFERSFREAEQELQTKETIHSAADPRAALSKTRMDGDDNGQADTVIPLPGMASRTSAEEQAGRLERRAGGDGNIISFRQRNGKR